MAVFNSSQQSRYGEIGCGEEDQNTMEMWCAVSMPHTLIHNNNNNNNNNNSNNNNNNNNNNNI